MRTEKAINRAVKCKQEIKSAKKNFKITLQQMLMLRLKCS